MGTLIMPTYAPYVRVANELRAKLEAGEYGGSGSKLPTLAEIAAEHGVSRSTARRACAILAGEGRIDLVQGYGMFVA
jgi:DNA-binding GntR family transcriptional regulator